MAVATRPKAKAALPVSLRWSALLLPEYQLASGKAALAEAADLNSVDTAAKLPNGNDLVQSRVTYNSLISIAGLTRPALATTSPSS